MAIFAKETGGNLVFPPKVGEKLEVVVKSLEKVEQTEFPERNLKKSKEKGGGDFGYYYVLHLEDGKTMPINTWRLYFAFQESGVDFGDTIIIDHPAAGKYIVAKTSLTTDVEKQWQE